jgi:hypothetical protein
MCHCHCRCRCRCHHLCTLRKPVQVLAQVPGPTGRPYGGLPLSRQDKTRQYHKKQNIKDEKRREWLGLAWLGRRVSSRGLCLSLPLPLNQPLEKCVCFVVFCYCVCSPGGLTNERINSATTRRATTTNKHTQNNSAKNKK